MEGDLFFIVPLNTAHLMCTFYKNNPLPANFTVSYKDFAAARHEFLHLSTLCLLDLARIFFTPVCGTDSRKRTTPKHEEEDNSFLRLATHRLLHLSQIVGICRLNSRCE